MANWLHQSFHRMRSWFRRAQLDRNLDAEMSAHLEFAVEENPERGLPPAEARRQALLRFGGPQQAIKSSTAKRVACRFAKLCSRICASPFARSANPPALPPSPFSPSPWASASQTSIFSVVDAVLLSSFPIRTRNKS